MKTLTWIVMNPTDSTYHLFKADSVESLGETLGATDIEENGTYIGHNSPAYQVACVDTTTIYDLRG